MKTRRITVVRSIDPLLRVTAILARAACAVVGMLALAVGARAYDLHFDYTSFESTFKQAQFDVLNYPSINGQYMNTSTDNHRQEMVNNGNELAQFYNWLTDRYAEQTVKNGAAAADVIHQYTINNSYDTSYDPDYPKWIVLNEISSSLWTANPGSPSISTYRTWLIDCVRQLRDAHGYNVVTLAPFQNPGQNNASWQALAEVSYIGIECYLSGTEVWNSGTTTAQRLAWATSQYQASKTSYMNRGVPEDRLFVTEHFANNGVTFINSQGQEQVVGWGRAGLVSASDWDQVIMIRQDAILNVGFDGFLAYNWGGNGMGVTQAEQIQHEYYYRTRRVLASQKPQWLSDSAINVNGTTIPLSWSQPLNWLGGVPNATGAEVNFWRTNTTSRTITLDGSKTVGQLTFESPASYTISPGTGGSIVFNDTGSVATLTSNQGSHTIATDVQLVDSLTANINTGITLTVSGIVSGSGGLTKNGAGKLLLSNTNSYAGNTNVQQGTLQINNRYLADAKSLLLSTSAALQLGFSGSPDIIDSLFIDGIAMPPGIWGAPGSVSQFTTTLIQGTGRLQVTNGPLLGDYNDDSLVDAADYVMWRKRFGAGFPPQAYVTWRGNFSEAEGGGGSEAVPEPAAWLLLGFAACASVARRRHIRPRRCVSTLSASACTL